MAISKAARELTPNDGRARVMIEAVTPQLDGGRFAVKHIIGDTVHVTADVFTDGHDSPTAVIRYRHESDTDWRERTMQSLVNDAWSCEFVAEQIGRYTFQVQAWVDHFGTWRADLKKRLAAGQDVTVDLKIGAKFVTAAAKQADGEAGEILTAWAKALKAGDTSVQKIVCEDEQLARLVHRHGPRNYATESAELDIVVDRPLARFSTWYEMFPRSASPDPNRNGNLQDVIDRLPYVASMNFDVLYLPPIHPVGRKFRKGKNNSETAQPEDVGSPWGIGAKEGGHKAVHPELGTLADFQKLVSAANEQGIEIAMDIAFQCAPDHPYVEQHPQWFRARPDGTIQYAENPPKKYQDIYPFDFETDDWQALWTELKSIFEYWIDQGVKVFRVDNPHTKPFDFWEWTIGDIKRKHPDVLFLAEAFTRPKVMHRLAKLGFSQSYTYFTWRNEKEELEEYLTELTQTPVREFFRPNFWPNTPDILHEKLQTGGRAAFMSRYVLAATLTSNIGVYGPMYEHCIGVPVAPGSEEYLDSEKYQVRHHDLERPDSLRHFIARVNQIRREQSALQQNSTLEFHKVDNDQIMCYSKHTVGSGDLILVVVNLHSTHTHAGFISLPLEELGLNPHQPYHLHDLLSDAHYEWKGPRNYVELNPQFLPAHIFHIRTNG